MDSAKDGQKISVIEQFKELAIGFRQEYLPTGKRRKKPDQRPKTERVKDYPRTQISCSQPDLEVLHQLSARFGVSRAMVLRWLIGACVPYVKLLIEENRFFHTRLGQAVQRGEKGLARFVFTDSERVNLRAKLSDFVALDAMAAKFGMSRSHLIRHFGEETLMRLEEKEREEDLMGRLKFRNLIPDRERRDWPAPRPAKPSLAKADEPANGPAATDGEFFRLSPGGETPGERPAAPNGLGTLGRTLDFDEILVQRHDEGLVGRMFAAAERADLTIEEEDELWGCTWSVFVGYGRSRRLLAANRTTIEALSLCAGHAKNSKTVRAHSSAEQIKADNANAGVDGCFSDEEEPTSAQFD